MNRESQAENGPPPFSVIFRFEEEGKGGLLNVLILSRGSRRQGRVRGRTRRLRRSAILDLRAPRDDGPSGNPARESLEKGHERQRLIGTERLPRLRASVRHWKPAARSSAS